MQALAQAPFVWLAVSGIGARGNNYKIADNEKLSRKKTPLVIGGAEDTRDVGGKGIIFRELSRLLAK